MTAPKAALGLDVAEERYQRERELHDTALNTRWDTVSKFYTVASRSEAFFQSLLTSGCNGKEVLEYGCGAGSSAFLLAELGARVTGIDLSGVRIERARDEAARLGLDVTFAVMNAEQLHFPDGSFDLICGSGILHHLELDLAFRELARTLRADGRGVFLEPLGHNPVINLYRRLTPGLRTPDEHPLVMGDFALASRHFRRVETYFFHLTSLMAVPFRRFGFFGRLVGGLEGVDRRLFERVPACRRFAWMTVIVLSGPRAS